MIQHNTGDKSERSSGLLLSQKRPGPYAKKTKLSLERQGKSRQGLITTAFVYFRMKEERAVCENNSKGVENWQGKDVWVISVHKCRYQNGKADKKIFQQK